MVFLIKFLCIRNGRIPCCASEIHCRRTGCQAVCKTPLQRPSCAVTASEKHVLIILEIISYWKSLLQPPTPIETIGNTGLGQMCLFSSWVFPRITRISATQLWTSHPKVFYWTSWSLLQPICSAFSGASEWQSHPPAYQPLTPIWYCSQTCCVLIPSHHL